MRTMPPINDVCNLIKSINFKMLFLVDIFNEPNDERLCKGIFYFLEEFQD